ncbi:MAG: polymerase ECF-type sigma factor, partial [Gammaproteobacteria bacterium]|nr:polymerase ECF-type sigma factor [Gammaproteobacteria bacterium]
MYTPRTWAVESRASGLLSDASTGCKTRLQCHRPDHSGLMGLRRPWLRIRWDFRDTSPAHSYISLMTSDVQETSGSLWRADATEPDWEAVFSEQLPRVYNYLRYRLGNETLAEDLTSRTFEKAWRGRDRYRRDLAKFSTWLLRIARNVAVDHRRTAHEHAPLETAAEEPAEGTPEEDAVIRSNFARLSMLIGRLPDRDRELLALKYGAGATNRAIAE